MNLPAYAQRFTGTAGSVGTTPVEIAITSPYAPPAEGWLYEIRLKLLAGPSTQARCEIYEQLAGRKIATYEDPDVPGGLVDIDGVGDTFHFADTQVRYSRVAGTFVVKVWTDDATNLSSVEAEVVCGGVG